MLRRELLQSALMALAGGLHIVRGGLTPNGKPRADCDEYFGSWDVQWVTGDVDLDRPSERAFFYDDCGRQIHPAGWLFKAGFKCPDDVYEGSIFLAFVDPASPSSEEPSFSSFRYDARLKFKGSGASQFAVSYTRSRENGLSLFTGGVGMITHAFQIQDSLQQSLDLSREQRKI